MQKANTSRPKKPDLIPTPVSQTVARPSGISAATAVLPLRLFLGISFIAAGLDKLTDPQFFNPSAPGYIGQQLTGFAQHSPLHLMLTNLAVPNATLFGWLVLLGELAIGLGTLVGLFTRTAAIFGALISFILWLTASWQVVPFFLGSDLPYAIGWITLAIAGAHPVWSLDGFIKMNVEREQAFPAQPQQFRQPKAGRGALNKGYNQPAALPFTATNSAGTDMNLARRRFLTVAGATLVVGLTTGAAWAKTWEEEGNKATAFKSMAAGAVSSSNAAAPISSAPNSGDTVPATTAPDNTPTAANAANSTTIEPATTGSNAATTAVPATPKSQATPTKPAAPAVVGTKLTALSSLPVGAAVKFTTPDTSEPAILIHESNGSVKAFSTVCTHEGCEVSYYQAYHALACPCHGAVFDITTGSPVQGPARRPLTNFKVQVDGQGNVIYVQQQ